MATKSSFTISSVTASQDSFYRGGSPLASLYGSQYSTNMLQYPADLGSSQKGHIVTFTAMKTVPSGFDTSNDVNLSGKNDVDEKTTLTFQPKRDIPSDVISLYMPDTLDFTYNASYTEVSLKDAAEEVAKNLPFVGKAVGALTSIVDSKAAQLAASGTGYAINPQQQLLFDSIDFRSFQMSFQFTPRDSTESSTIRDIIKTFRLHAAPTLDTGIGGMFFTVPDSFIIKFTRLGNTNDYITRVKESVLTSVDVNYAPNGIWSAHLEDGSPTQINLTLQFKEIALVDSTAIQNGF